MWLRHTHVNKIYVALLVLVFETATEGGCPGATNVNFFEEIKSPDARSMQIIDPRYSSAVRNIVYRRPCDEDERRVRSLRNCPSLR